ncbi:hypothetical protein HA630_07415, partial [Aquabacterium sp. A08]|nr:hypothetical protein [Aquabacterium sp. A08]
MLLNIPVSNALASSLSLSANLSSLTGGSDPLLELGLGNGLATSGQVSLDTGDLLAPVTGLVDSVLGTDALAPVTDLLGGDVLAPVTGLLDGVLGGDLLGGDVLAP